MPRRFSPRGRDGCLPLPMLRTGVTNGLLSTDALAPVLAMFDAGKGAAEAGAASSAALKRPAHAATVRVGMVRDTAYRTRS